MWNYGILESASQPLKSVDTIGDYLIFVKFDVRLNLL